MIYNWTACAFDRNAKTGDHRVMRNRRIFRLHWLQIVLVWSKRTHFAERSFAAIYFHERQWIRNVVEVSYLGTTGVCLQAFQEFSLLSAAWPVYIIDMQYFTRTPIFVCLSVWNQLQIVMIRRWVLPMVSKKPNRKEPNSKFQCG